MKQCPQCQNRYSDESVFCLSDGTPLKYFFDEPEQPTVVIRPFSSKSGVNPKFFYSALGLAVLLFGCVIILGLALLTKTASVIPSNINTESPKISANPSPSITPIPTVSQTPMPDTTESNFPLPPLISGNWRTLDKQASQNLLDQLLKNTPSDWKGMARRITKFRGRQLSFYSGANLYEGLVPAATSRDDSIFTFITLKDGNITLLNGTSPPIHELNKKVPLVVDTKERAEEYLKFFCSAVFGDDGSFRLIEDKESVRWAQDATETDKGKVTKYIQPLLTTKLDDGRWKATSTVQYGGGLFNAVFYAKPTGEVEMSDDMPVTSSNLPLRREAFNGYVRHEVDMYK